MLIKLQHHQKHLVLVIHLDLLQEAVAAEEVIQKLLPR
jgi:hypothetical protein